jgi:glycosyltransferase involved in cell wall biosynthesis
MKILFLTLDLGSTAGGLYYSVRGLSREFLARGELEVEVVGLINDENLSDLSSWDGIPVKYFRCKKLFGKFSYSLGLIKYVYESDADIIYLHGMWNFSSLLLRVIGMKKEIRYVVCPRGMLDKWIFEKNKLIKRMYWTLFENRLLQSAGFIHALNDNEAMEIKKVLPNVNIVVSSNGIDRVVDTVPDYSLSKKRMIFLGRIDAKKGVLELLAAWAEIKQNNWELFIYGWGDPSYVDKVKRFLVDNECEAYYMGPVFGEEKNVALKSAHAFVLPSFSEGLPMAILEAWSYGLPALITDECNLPDSYSNGAGYNISHEQGLISGLSDFMAFKNSDYEYMSTQAKNYVNENYTWKKIAKKLILEFKSEFECNE